MSNIVKDELKVLETLSFNTGGEKVIPFESVIYSLEYLSAMENKLIDKLETIIDNKADAIDIIKSILAERS